ncbi:MAG: hypothetical protein KJO31_01785 [Gammaproteobacteria bacterium]|nr:hypothetical protein [Gammaproteobacteria bacterium]
MSWYDRLYRNVFKLLILLAVSGPALGDSGDYVVGLGADLDSAEGRAFSLFGDFGLTDQTWLSAIGAYTSTDEALGFDATYADLSIDHNFEPIGIRVGGAYWGDADLLDSVDLRAAVYFRNEHFSLSLDYERRDFDFLFQSLLLDRERKVSFSANGAGLTSWFQLNKRTSFYVGGMDYDYSVDIQLQENIDVLRFLSVSRLSLINSLVDYRINGGVNVNVGDSSLDFSISNWRTEVDQGQVTSYGIGFTTPLDRASDLELRVAYDDSENFGDTYVFSVYFYTFGS